MLKSQSEPYLWCSVFFFFFSKKKNNFSISMKRTAKETPYLPPKASCWLTVSGAEIMLADYKQGDYPFSSALGVSRHLDLQPGEWIMLQEWEAPLLSEKGSRPFAHPAWLRRGDSWTAGCSPGEVKFHQFSSSNRNSISWLDMGSARVTAGPTAALRSAHCVKVFVLGYL